jgi:hypothetical protein
MYLPKVICTSVIRSSYKGESHGGCYIVDLASDKIRQVLDWNDESINWEGRGGDRGLRGIAFFKNKIYVASSDEIFVFDGNFNISQSFRNKYLKHCHEIFIYDNILFLTSTGYDSILEFNLINEKFIRGYYIKFGKYQNAIKHAMDKLNLFEVNPSLYIFDPNDDFGPIQKDNLHINNVFYEDNKLFFSGRRLNRLYTIQNNKIKPYGKVPIGTHNTKPYYKNILFNDTSNNKVAISKKNGEYIETFDIPLYNKNELLMNNIPNDQARQGFGRGIAITEDGLIIGGSSPSTISVYEPCRKDPIKSLKLTMDIRNCIHGLEVFTL